MNPRIPSIMVVDDSLTMRPIIRTWLERDDSISVVGEAADPYEAREAVKTLSPDGVNFTAGLAKVRTSPDHGTAYDIAGQDKADAQSMRSAACRASRSSQRSACSCRGCG